MGLLGRASAVLSEVLEHLVTYFLVPSFLVGHFVMSTWALCYELAWRSMISPCLHGTRFTSPVCAPGHGLAVGAVILGLTIFMRLIWVPPAAYAFWQAHVYARFSPAMKPTDAPFRSIMQVSNTSPDQRRLCATCGIHMEDRTYHCYQVGRCLRVYDHYCPFWWGPVFDRNFKAYMVFTSLVPLDLVYTFAVVLYSIIAHAPLGKRWWLPYAVLTLTVLFFPLALGFARQAWSRVKHNRTLKERARPMTIRVSRSDTFVHNDRHLLCRVNRGSNHNLDNPFDLGTKANIEMIMGRKRSWMLFWTPTPLMQTTPASWYRDHLHDLRASLVEEAAGVVGADASTPAAAPASDAADAPTATTTALSVRQSTATARGSEARGSASELV